MANRAEFRRAAELLTDLRWRLNNLYYITDKDGRRVRFELNWAQERLFNSMHYQNAILKARQLGFTTFIQLRVQQQRHRAEMLMAQHYPPTRFPTRLPANGRRTRRGWTKFTPAAGHTRKG
jgi:hypothetical protein